MIACKNFTLKSGVLNPTQKIHGEIFCIKDKEIRAEIGAIYTLRREGIKTWPFWFEFDADFAVAMKIYKSNKIK